MLTPEEFNKVVRHYEVSRIFQPAVIGMAVISFIPAFFFEAAWGGPNWVLISLFVLSVPLVVWFTVQRIRYGRVLRTTMDELQRILALERSRRSEPDDSPPVQSAFEELVLSLPFSDGIEFPDMLTAIAFLKSFGAVVYHDRVEPITYAKLLGEGDAEWACAICKQQDGSVRLNAIYARFS